MGTKVDHVFENIDFGTKRLKLNLESFDVHSKRFRFIICNARCYVLIYILTSKLFVFQ